MRCDAILVLLDRLGEPGLAEQIILDIDAESGSFWALSI